MLQASLKSLVYLWFEERTPAFKIKSHVKIDKKFRDANTMKKPTET